LKRVRSRTTLTLVRPGDGRAVTVVVPNCIDQQVLKRYLAFALGLPYHELTDTMEITVEANGSVVPDSEWDKPDKLSRFADRLLVVIT
jgi:sulfur carrier protein ThiS